MIYDLGDRRPKLDPGRTYIAPGAAVIGDVHLGPDTSIWFNAVLRGDLEPIKVGEGSNIQEGCVLHTDPGAPLVIHEFVTIGHLAMLHGCEIGRQTIIGIGSTVLNRARVGANSIVGAHSLVTEGKSFPDGVLILGAPAKVIRDLTKEELDSLPEAARRYIDRGRLFREKLAPTPGEH